ncbi:MAG: ROK family protein [Microscillaceae bacterium]
MIMAKKKVALGLDIGGTTTTYGFVDAQGEILFEAQMQTRSKEHVTAYLPRLYKALDAAFAQVAEQTDCIGIGIGAPNANYFRGTVENPPNLNWGGVVNLSELVQNQYQLPVAITNDANAAALGEMKFGAARGMKNFILITLGTGLGSGIVVNGELVYGHSGFAGEMGHLIVNSNGRICGDGRRGCLEAYVSVTGIRRTVSKLLADSLAPSELRNVGQDDLSGERIAQAALNGDKIALEAFEYTGRILGQKLADTVLITSPEAVILFGGLANSKDLIFEPTLRHLERNLFGPFRGTVKLMISELQEKNAAVLGAAGLIWHEMEKRAGA